MFLLAVLAIAGLTGLTLWFTAWAERELLSAPPETSSDEGRVMYVLVETMPGRAPSAAEELARLPWAASVSAVGGPYDIIVRTRDGSAVRPARARADVAKIAGIVRALPCSSEERAEADVRVLRPSAPPEAAPDATPDLAV
jgi:hypothetical protein